jgi:hypothetical protein
MDDAGSAGAGTLDLASLEPRFSADPFPVYDRLRTSVACIVNHGLPGWSQRRSVRRSSAGTPTSSIITMPGSCIPNSSTRSVLEVDDRAATAAAAHSVRA